MDAESVLFLQKEKLREAQAFTSQGPLHSKGQI